MPDTSSSQPFATRTARRAWALAAGAAAAAVLAGCSFGESSAAQGADASPIDAAAWTVDAPAPAVDALTEQAPVEAGPSDAAAEGSGSTAPLSIGGNVTGLVGKGLVLQDDGTDSLPIAADGAFAFPARLAPGTTYAVTVLAQPSGPTQTCSVASGTGVAEADVTDVQVTCTTAAYPVGGTLVGLDPTSTGGVVLVDTLGGGATDTLTVDQNGSFVFPTKVPSGSAYAVSVKADPTSPPQSCSVSGGTGTVVAGAVTSVVVNCSANAHLLGGTVSGLSGQGLVLQNGTSTVGISANGSFAFPAAIASGASYAVSVATQPSSPSQTCTVAGGSGVMGAADVASVTVSCTTNAYPVGGTVSGLSGGGLVLQDDGADALPVAADGTFTFATSVPSGAPYAVTVQSQPTAPWQTCTVSGGSGVVGAGPVTGVQVACTTNPYVVQVAATGVVGAGLTLTLNGGDPLAIPGNGTYAFDTALPSGAAYTVAVSIQPSQPAQSCVVGNATGVVAGGPVTGVTVDCSPNVYAIGGTVSGLTGTGLVLTDNGVDSLTVPSSATAFRFPIGVASGGGYDVEIASQPTNPSQTCSVSGNKGTVVAADVAGVVVNCGTNTFTVGGTVTGLAGKGLVLRNGSATLPVTAQGSFAFPAIASGSTYDVTVDTEPSSPTQQCTVTGGKGTVGGANVTDVQVACATQSFPVGGAVTGLAAGTSVVLEDNGGDDLPVTANGSFTFKTPVASGASYAVTVKTQPTSPWQTCALTGGTGTGTVGAGAVSVAVACTTNQYQVSAAVSGLLGGGLTLALAGGTTPIAQDGTYALGGKLASGSTYAVTVSAQPTGPSQTCTVGAPGTTIGGSDVTVTVTCTTNQYTVGGTVSGLTGTGLALTNSDDGDTVTIPGGATSFTFPKKVASGQTFDVSVTTQPASPTQKCSVTGQQGTVGAGAVATIAVNCSTQTFTIGGTITVDGGTGTLGAGLALTNGAETIHPSATGSFAFTTPVASGGTYGVTVTGQPTAPVQSCTASANSGTVGNGNVNTVVVTCTTTTFHVKASVSQLPGGDSMVLEDDGGDDLTVTGNGTATFATPVASGKGYSVSIKTQPAHASCTVFNPGGTIASSDVTVTVICTPVYTLTVTLNGLESGGGGAQVVVNGTTYAPSGNTVSLQLDAGSSYAVSLATQPSGQTCTSSATAGTMTGNVSVTYSCGWNVALTVQNGNFKAAGGEYVYVPCASIPFDLAGSYSSSATVTASGSSTVTFPPYTSVPQGASVTITFPGGVANAAGACECGTAAASLASGSLVITSNPSVSGPVTSKVLCAWIAGG